MIDIDGLKSSVVETFERYMLDIKLCNNHYDDVF